MKKSKALILDLDGTAIDSPTTNLPSERLIQAVRNVREAYYVCAATGRPWPFARQSITSLGLVDPCIISGGTQICKPHSGDILWQCNIAPTDAQRVLAVLASYPYRVLVNEWTEEEYYTAGPVMHEPPSDAIYYIDCVFIPEEDASEVAADLDRINGITHAIGTSLKPGHSDIVITSSAATKEHAVAELLTHLEVDSRDAYGFGDGMNDTHLFQAVGHKIAMGNARPELKAMADEVIGLVGEDGLAQYLERL
jgi:Cof subfamily protein (haloacid dehalogenase superfamily)